MGWHGCSWNGCQMNWNDGILRSSKIHQSYACVRVCFEGVWNTDLHKIFGRPGNLRSLKLTIAPEKSMVGILDFPFLGGPHLFFTKANFWWVLGSVIVGLLVWFSGALVYYPPKQLLHDASGVGLRWWVEVDGFDGEVDQVVQWYRLRDAQSQWVKLKLISHFMPFFSSWRLWLDKLEVFLVHHLQWKLKKPSEIFLNTRGFGGRFLHDKLKFQFSVSLVVHGVASAAHEFCRS